MSVVTQLVVTLVFFGILFLDSFSNPFRAAVPFWGQTGQLHVICPQNGTAVLKGIRKGGKKYEGEHHAPFRCMADALRFFFLFFFLALNRPAVPAAAAAAAVSAA